MSRVALVLAAAVAAGAAPAAHAADPGRTRGPFSAREEFLLAQPLLSLPPMAAAILGTGRTEVRLEGEWGNDFGVQTGPGGRANDLRYLIDGEHRTAAVTVRRGFGRGITVAARLPVHWRGGGWLDDVIDPFHRLFDLPDSGRSLYRNRLLQVSAGSGGGDSLSWTGRSGTGMGSPEVELMKSLRSAAGGTSIAVLARGRVPVSTGPFRDAGGGLAAQIVASQPAGPMLDLHAGVGASSLGPREVDGLAYRRSRAHGFAALEWRPVPAWSAIVQWEASSRLLADVERYPGFQLALRIGSKIDLGERWTVEGGFIEGVKPLESTTDFGVFAGLARRF